MLFTLKQELQKIVSDNNLKGIKQLIEMRNAINEYKFIPYGTLNAAINNKTVTFEIVLELLNTIGYDLQIIDDKGQPIHNIKTRYV